MKLPEKALGYPKEVVDTSTENPKTMTSFQERQKSLFNTLKEAEDTHSFSKTNRANTPNDNAVIDRQVYRRLKHEMKPFRGRESIFKRPEANIRQCLRSKTVPDYIKNPQRWSHYSLADVSADQMSDSTNAATAYAFLQELEDKNIKAELVMEQDSNDGVFKKPTFNISAQLKKDQQAKEEKPVFKNNKLVMPEYVVGGSPKIKKERPVKKENSVGECAKKAELKLSHLYTEED